MVRTALVTLRSWPDLYTMLKDTAALHAPLARVLQGSLSPPYWDTPAFVETLHEATSGFPHHPRLCRFMPQVIRSAKLLIESASPGQPLRLQGHLTRAIFDKLHTDSVPSLLSRRLRVLAPTIVVSDLDLSNVQALMKRLPTAWATTILKTWANGWTTTHRLHAPQVRLCVFGCAHRPDTLHHYLRCRILWDAAASDEDATDDSLIARRLVLTHPDRGAALLLVTHALFYNSAKTYRSRLSDTVLAQLREAARLHAVSRAYA